MFSVSDYIFIIVCKMWKKNKLKLKLKLLLVDTYTRHGTVPQPDARTSPSAIATSSLGECG